MAKKVTTATATSTAKRGRQKGSFMVSNKSKLEFRALGQAEQEAYALTRKLSPEVVTRLRDEALTVRGTGKGKATVKAIDFAARFAKMTAIELKAEKTAIDAAYNAEFESKRNAAADETAAKIAAKKAELAALEADEKALVEA